MFKKLVFSLLLLVLSIPMFGQIAETDFSKDAILTGKGEFVDWWGDKGLGVPGSIGSQFPCQPVVVKDGVMTIPFCIGDYGGQGFRKTGLTIWKSLPVVENAKSIYSEFVVKFGEDFDWGINEEKYRGGKFGLSWEVGNISAGKIPSQGSFQVTTMWRGGGAMDAYIYLPDQKNKYPDKRIHNYIERNKWYKFGTEIKINDVGKSNGYVKVWINDELSLELKDRNLVNTESVTFKPSFGNFFGGSGTGWKSRTKSNIQYKYIKVYKSREEALGGSNPDPSPDPEPDPNPEPSPNEIVIAMLKEEIKRLSEEVEGLKADRDGLKEKIDAIGLIIN